MTSFSDMSISDTAVLCSKSMRRYPPIFTRSLMTVQAVDPLPLYRYFLALLQGNLCTVEFVLPNMQLCQVAK
jgi:hypothetical protein